MCAVCHPGGGSLEYDRNGNRYDRFAEDPKNNIIPGGPNGLDGDYFKSNWARSGAMEADCLMCHLKDYDNGLRKNQLKSLNFRWAATAGAGFADIVESVAKKETPKVTYDLSRFGPDGKVTLPVMKKPLNENCLFCHHEPGWKKRGQSFSKRTDVHMRAGLLCVDCHVTGRSAADPRIYGKEEHQIGKGDDPGDFVRDDLDNTMRTCEDCHLKGILNAPVPKHKGFPPAHFEHIACQTCHIPWHQVKGALMQDASVFNTSPRISPPPKRIWSFYGPDMKPWNYYGFALGYPEGLQPLTQYRPVHGLYKGKIYPLNRVYTRWAGIKTEGKSGIGMPHMKDIFMMWKTHMDTPDKNYPLLSTIKDDNQDGFLEVNRPEEIRALVTSVTAMLEKKGEVLDRRRVVFVDGDRYTSDGNTWTDIPKKLYEYSPYGSVFKYSHDISPAKNALGANSCTDCHAFNSPFFTHPVMIRPFDENARASYEPNATLLGFSSMAVFAGGLRQEVLKPVLFYGILAGLSLLLILLVCGQWAFGAPESNSFPQTPAQRLMTGIIGIGLLGPAIIILFESMLPSDIIGVLENIHRWAGAGLVVATLWLVAKSRTKKAAFLFWTGVCGVAFMASTGIALWGSGSDSIRQILFTLHDMSALFITFLAIAVLVLAFFKKRKDAEYG